MPIFENQVFDYQVATGVIFISYFHRPFCLEIKLKNSTQYGGARLEILAPIVVFPFTK